MESRRHEALTRYGFAPPPPYQRDQTLSVLVHMRNTHQCVTVPWDGPIPAVGSPLCPIQRSRATSLRGSIREANRFIRGLSPHPDDAR